MAKHTPGHRPRKVKVSKPRIIVRKLVRRASARKK